MSYINETTCRYCNHTVREYPHKLNKSLVGALIAFYRRIVLTKADVALDSIGLTHSQQANWQKLQYFGLITRDGDTERVNKWSITNKGVAFLKGEIMVLDRVNTFNMEVRENSTADLKYIYQIVDNDFWGRSDYLNDSNL